MTITGENGATVEVDTFQYSEEDPPEVTLMIDDGHNRHRVRVTFDAKQALAFSLALQAAMAEIAALKPPAG